MADFNKTQTIQSGINKYDSASLRNFSLFMGGINVTNPALAQWDPLRTGYGRLFMIRYPKFMIEGDWMVQEMRNFRHILEYGFTSISGLNDITMNFNSITGGYTGRSFEIPSYAQDDTNSFTVTCYELRGSPLREVCHMWLNGVSDFQTGLSHYNGSNLPVKQSNHTAEFIYLVTDPSGKNVEYACLLTNCMPKAVKLDQFNTSAGTHDLVEYQIEFTCTRYHSLQINKNARDLLAAYNVMYNSLNFHSGYNTSVNATTHKNFTNGSVINNRGYNVDTGKLDNVANINASYSASKRPKTAFTDQVNGSVI